MSVKVRFEGVSGWGFWKASDIRQIQSFLRVLGAERVFSLYIGVTSRYHFTTIPPNDIYRAQRRIWVNFKAIFPYEAPTLYENVFNKHQRTEVELSDKGHFKPSHCHFNVPFTKVAKMPGLFDQIMLFFLCIYLNDAIYLCTSNTK